MRQFIIYETFIITAHNVQQVAIIIPQVERLKNTSCQFDTQLQHQGFMTQHEQQFVLSCFSH